MCVCVYVCVCVFVCRVGRFRHESSVGQRREVWSFDVNASETRIVAGSSEEHLTVYRLFAASATRALAQQQLDGPDSAPGGGEAKTKESADHAETETSGAEAEAEAGRRAKRKQPTNAGQQLEEPNAVLRLSVCMSVCLYA